MTRSWEEQALGVWRVAAALLALVPVLSANAAEPLHVRIDQTIEAAHRGPLAPAAGDAEFLRRVALDLNGMPPTAQEARDFLADAAPDKRTALIDRLLNGPRYALHFANVFDVILMERRAGEGVKPPEWQEYLRQSFAQNKPWDQLAREILAADGADGALRPAARFYLDRGGEPNLLARDVGRIFFGRDLQCAQCHDHPLIDGYRQSDYYGLYAFFNRSFLFTDKDKKVFMAEKSDGSVSFQSVFDPEKIRYNTRPRLPGDVELDEPFFAVGDDYNVAPAENVRPVPKYSRRNRLVEETLARANPAFRRNIVNRLWAHMMGRGLVEPVDLHHPDNPPSYPALLDLLADEFAAQKYDIKAFLRELALTAAYQRTVEMPANLAEFARQAPKALAELEAEEKTLEAARDAIDPKLAQLDKDLAPLRRNADQIGEELAKANTAAAEAKKAADTSAQALAKTQAELAAKTNLSQLLAATVDKANEAAAFLPADSELKELAAKFKAKADATAAQVAELTKTAETQAGPAQTQAEALAAAQQASRDIAAKLAAANEALKPLDEQRTAALVERKTLETSLNALKNRAAEQKALIEYGQTLDNIADSHKSIESAQAALAEGKRGVEAASVETIRRQTALAAAEKEAAEAVKPFAEVQAQLAARDEIVRAVAEAAAKADTARQKLPDDADLIAAAEKLRGRAEALERETAPLRRETAERKQTADAAAAKAEAARQAVEAAVAETDKARQRVAELEGALAQAEEKLAALRGAADTAHADLTKRFSAAFAVGVLRPLAPEQLAWSTMRAAGVVEQQRAAVEAELNQKEPINPADMKPEIAARRAEQVEQNLFAKLSGNVAQFVRMFGGEAGQPQRDFFATVDQALFFANGGELRSWLSPGGGNLTERLTKIDDPQAVAEEAYLAVLTRRPSSDEVDDVAAYLAARSSERGAAVQEIVWGLLTSAEFRFNH